MSSSAVRWCKEESSLGDIALVAVQEKGVVPERRDGGKEEHREKGRKEGGILVGLNTNTDVAMNNELLDHNN